MPPHPRIPNFIYKAYTSHPVKPETGRILIDNIDISTVNTQTLRNRIVRSLNPP